MSVSMFGSHMWELYMYPWKLSVINLPREMAVTHRLVFYHGKRLCYCNK